MSAENNFFRHSTPQKHYVTICLSAYAVDESQLKNMEPDKCEDWEWVSATELLNDSGRYRPLFVPLRNIFVKMGLVKG